MEPARDERAAERAADVGAVVDQRRQEPAGDRIDRPDQEHEADTPVAEQQAVTLRPEEDDRGALQTEDRPRRAHRRPRARHEAHERASEPARHVENDELAAPERVLADHAEDEERDRVADEVIQAAVEKRGAHQAPVLARDHALAHERPGRDDSRGRCERAQGRLCPEDHGEHADDRQRDGRRAAHPPLEVDAAGEQHVRRDAERRLGRRHHRRSPVSSMIASASAMRRSRARPGSAERSST